MKFLDKILNFPVNLAGHICLVAMSAEPHSDTWTKIVGLGLIPLVIGLNIWIYFKL